MTKPLLLAALSTLCLAPAGTAATVFTSWTFEGDVLTPATGSGTVSLVGGTTSTFAAGSGGGRAFNTSTYAAQGTGSGERGAAFMVSTVGFEDISFSYEHRSSGTASRWAQLDYTLDGSTWTTGFWNNGGGISPHDAFYTFTIDLSSIAGADENPNFGVRIVSIFSPTAFDQNLALPDYAANAAYMRSNADATYTLGAGLGTSDYGAGGTWRFDNVSFSGTAVIPEPSHAALLIVGLAACATRRRKSSAC